MAQGITVPERSLNVLRIFTYDANYRRLQWKRNKRAHLQKQWIRPHCLSFPISSIPPSKPPSCLQSLPTAPDTTAACALRLHRWKKKTHKNGFRCQLSGTPLHWHRLLIGMLSLPHSRWHSKIHHCLPMASAYSAKQRAPIAF